MTQTFAARFEDGAFKPLKTEGLTFSPGQLVSLTVQPPWEQNLSIAELEEKYAREYLNDTGDKFEVLRNDPLFQRAFPVERRGITAEPEKTTSEVILDSLSVPPGVWRAMKRKFGDIVYEVRNTDPPEPDNKVQKYTRKSLALFTNISSLFIYVVLIAATLKILILFGAHHTKVFEALKNMGIYIVPFIFVIVLVCLFLRQRIAIDCTVHSILPSDDHHRRGRSN